MADLITRIGADDAEFRRGMDSVDSRMTSFYGSVRRTSSVMQGFLKLGGAAIAVSYLSDLAKKLTEVMIAADNAGDSIRKMGQGVVDSVRPRDPTLSAIDQQIRDMRDRVNDQKKTIEEEANRQSTEIRVRDLNPFTKAAWQIVTGKTTDQQIDEIQSAKERELKRIGEFTNRKELELRQADNDKAAAEYRDSRAEAEKTYNDFVADRRRSMRSIASDAEDEQLAILESLGFGRQAEIGKLGKRLRSINEEIYADSNLTENEKEQRIGFFEQAFGPMQQIIDATHRRNAMLGAKTLTYQADGSGFAQQLQAVTQSRDINLRLLKAVESGFERMQEAARKIGGTVYGP